MTRCVLCPHTVVFVVVLLFFFYQKHTHWEARQQVSLQMAGCLWVIRVGLCDSLTHILPQQVILFSCSPCHTWVTVAGFYLFSVSAIKTMMLIPNVKCWTSLHFTFVANLFAHLTLKLRGFIKPTVEFRTQNITVHHFGWWKSEE